MLRVEDQLAADAQDDVAGAGDVRDLARLADPQPERAEHGVGRAQDDRDLRAAQPGRRLGPQRRAGGRRPHVRQPRPRCADAGRRPGPRRSTAGFQLVAAIAGGGARVGGQLTGQPGEQVVLGRGHGRRGGRTGGIDRGDPAEHRQQVAAVHPLAGQPVQPGGAAPLAERITQVVGPAVLPGDRGPVRPSVRAEGDERGKHAGQADGPPAPGRDHLAELRHHPFHRAPPVGGVLLARSGRGPVRGVGRAAPGEDRRRTCQAPPP